MRHDGRRSGGGRSKDVPTGLVNAIGDGGERHHALVQQPRLVVLKRLTVGPYASLGPLICSLLRKSRTEILRVLLNLADSLGAQACSALREGVHFPDPGVRGGREGQGLGGGLGFLGEVLSGGLQCFGDVAGGGDDEARGHGGFGDEGAVPVGGVHGHF